MADNANQISSKNNRISYFNDKVEHLWSNLFFNKLPRNFEVVILSGMPEQSNSPNAGEAISGEFNSQNDNRFYFVRVRPLKTAGVIIPSPFETKDLTEAKRLINMHPIAYIAVNDSPHPPAHGDIYLCRYTRRDRLGLALIKRQSTYGKTIKSISNRGAHIFYNNNSPILLGQPSDKYDDSRDPLKQYGLKRKRGIYNGAYIQKGTEVLNGYPNWGKQLLEFPNFEYWQYRTDAKKKPKYPAGTILKDVVGSFNEMAKAFKEHFNHKLICSTQRSVEGQISVRKNGVKKGTCRDMQSKSGRWVNDSGETKYCKSATPGTSKHGWACAVDIQQINGKGKLTFSCKEYKWLLEWSKSPEAGWHNPSWAKIDGSLPEAWHWEPKEWPITLL